ncbi:MAG: TIR domain-containing protein [Phaeodactylibacter xiamenensis]|uniref:TIR domain-containing protein n=1 Tax=Phaeodactylibacter xiamenensis TaxID=1524460 RepID=UPI000698356E|nr:TIR domain-containing protein [Phaeodactylibacter xiamenensis]MCR9052297.1 toll/interleukin-1 receptor domain-containing protein [bacterium]
MNPQAILEQIDLFKDSVATAADNRQLSQLSERLTALLNAHFPDAAETQIAILLTGEMHELRHREMKGVISNADRSLARNQWVDKFLNLLGDAKNMVANNQSGKQSDAATTPESTPAPLRLFLSYAEADQDLKNRLDNHLTALKRGNLIDLWSDEQVLAGHDWGAETKRNIQDADIVLLLVSASFIASEHIWKSEVEKALARRREGVIVVPVALKPVDWEGLPFAGLQGLPRSGKPVTTYNDLDLGLLEVAKGVREVVEYVHRQKA